MPYRQEARGVFLPSAGYYSEMPGEQIVLDGGIFG